MAQSSRKIINAEQKSEPTLGFKSEGLYKNYLQVYGKKQPNHLFRLVIPICIGYRGSEGVVRHKINARLAAVIENAMQSGMDYMLFLAPKKPEMADEWKKANADVLASIPDDKVVSSVEWRNGEVWKKADEVKRAFYAADPRLTRVLAKLKQDDAGAYASRNEKDDVPATEGEAHVDNEATDILSWMASSSDASNRLITLVLHQNFSTTMTNVYQQAKKMGFAADSLFFVKFDNILQAKTQKAEAPAVKEEDIMRFAAQLAKEGKDPGYVFDFFKIGITHVRREVSAAPVSRLEVESEEPMPSPELPAKSISVSRSTAAMFGVAKAHEPQPSETLSTPEVSRDFPASSPRLSGSAASSF